MKHNMKIFLIALVLGIIAAYIFMYKFDNTIIVDAIDAKVTIFYVGAYNNLEAATRKKNEINNSIIYNEDGIYKVIIGVYKEKESIELMESYFDNLGIKFRTSTLKVNSSFLKLCKNYELLIPSSDTSYYENINHSLLNLLDKNES